MIETPLTLPNGQILKNRLVKGAMTEGLADEVGRPTDDLIRLYERWAEGGTGLLLTGNIQVDRDHLERAGNVIIDREPDALMADRLSRLAEAGKRNGARIWAQLSHAGRQTPRNINSAPKAPSAVPLTSFAGVCADPVAMTHDEILDVVQRFVTAARAVKAAGFDGIQLHGAHGYLFSQFLSPTSNLRDDEWGGSLANRAKLLLTVLDEVKRAVGPDFGVGVKLNSADFQRGGFEIDDSIQVSKWLDEGGVDFIEISGGTYEAPMMVGYNAGAQKVTRAREAYFIEFAPRIRAALKRAKLLVTGGFRSRAAMEEALANDGIDLIGIGRPLCGYPDASEQILSGSQPALPRYEDLIQIGPGLLSQRSPIGFFKTLNSKMCQLWYYQNIVRIAQDRMILRPGQLFKAGLEFRKMDAAKAEALLANRPKDMQ